MTRLPAHSPRRQQLPEEVASYVRDLIMSGAVRSGEFLRMERIAEAVGVSNTPVREGLLILRSEGFVKLEPRRGFMVASFTQQDLRDLFWVQAQISGELAARAAKKVTPGQIRTLSENVDEYERAVEAKDDERIAHLGHSFHREINLIAESYRLALLLGSIVNHSPNRYYATLEGQVAATRRDHPAIVDALRQRQVRKARSVMEQHILDRADHLIGVLEERGLWDQHAEVG